MSVFDEYKKELLKPFSDEHSCFLYWKGRVGLYSILKAIGVGPGDEVIIPGFTCVVVPNAIIYLGAKPVYADIDLDSLNVSLDRIKALRTDKTKAVIVQNTFGLSSEPDKIAQWCKEQSLFSIEDCTHGYGSEYKNKPNGSYCDAAFFSTQWNKPFSTGIGGFVITADTKLKVVLATYELELLKPSWIKSISLQLQLFARRLFLNPRTYWTLLRLYRVLSKWNILTGSSSGGEIEGTKEPQDYWMAMAEVQARKGLQALKSLDQRIRLKRKNAESITRFLKGNQKWHVEEAFHADHGFLKYPILVKDRVKFLELAEQNRVELGDWFLSVLHPVRGELTEWNYEVGQCPNGEYVSKHIVNLPLEGKPETLTRFLKDNLAQVL